MKKTFVMLSACLSLLAAGLASATEIAVNTAYQGGLIAHEICVKYMSLVGMMLFDVDPQMQQITELLTKQGEVFNEFKAKNDQRISEIEQKGKATEETLKEVKALNDQLTEIAIQIKATGERLDDMEKKGNRPGNGNDPAPEVAEHKTKFYSFMRTGDDDGLADLEAKAFQAGSDVDGGYLVPAELDMELTRVASAVCKMRDLADVKTIGKASIKMRVKVSGTAGRWVGEGEQGGETPNSKYAVVEIAAEEMEIEPWVYNSALDDADYNVEQDVTEEAGIGFGEAEGAAFINGNGIKKPRGILTYPIVANANYAWGKVGYIPSGGASSFAASNPGDALITLIHSLKSAYRAGAVLLMNDATLGLIRQMKDGSGNFYLFNPDATGKFDGFVLGVPVEIDDNMPDVGANSYPIAFANFKRAYRVVDRKGVALIRDNITEKGTTKFNFRKRVGGGIKNFEAIKLLKIATS